MNTLLRRNSLPSLLAAPIIWGVHFLVCYIWVSLVCALGLREPRLFGLDPAELGIGLVTLIALALLASLFLANYHKWQHIRRPDAAEDEISAFFALNSMMLGALSAIALVWVAFPTLMLPPCA